MIKAILIFNNHGKPRLIRFYQYFVSIFEVAAQNISIFPSLSSLIWLGVAKCWIIFSQIVDNPPHHKC